MDDCAPSSQQLMMYALSRPLQHRSLIMLAKLPCRSLVVLAALLLTPGVACANAGTPLMWLTLGHLLLGNLLLGMAEGALLERLYPCRTCRAVLAMIAANYVSSWVGVLLVYGVLLPGEANRQILDLFDITTIRVGMPLLIVFMYVLTVVLEWPLVRWALPPSADEAARPWREALRASFVIQSCSYLVLMFFYAYAGSYTLIEAEVVDARQFALPRGLQLYYILPDGKTVVRRGLDDLAEPAAFVFRDAAAQSVALRVSGPPQEGTVWQLQATGAKNGGPPSVRWALPLPSQHFADGCLLAEHRFRVVPVLVAGHSKSIPSSCGGRYVTSVWAAEGFEDRVRRRSLGLETGVGSWRVQTATELPGDLIVFQVGRDQICLYDPARQRIALLARGRDPVVVWK